MTTCTENRNQSAEKNLYDSSGNLVQRFQQWLEIQRLKANLRRERLQLLNMSDTMLEDLGITRGQANEEARRIDMPESRKTRTASLEC